MRSARARGAWGSGWRSNGASLVAGTRRCQALEAAVRGAVGTGSGDGVDVDGEVRLRSFAFLESKSTLYPDALPRRVAMASSVPEAGRGIYGAARTDPAVDPAQAGSVVPSWRR